MDSIKVLLVDDERDFLAPLVKRLTRRSMDVRAAHSGEEALELLESDPAEVVVLDVKMPGMDGVRTLREIRNRHPLAEVILFTGHADLSTAVQGMEIGAFDYLMKPVGIDELVYKIQDAHQRRLIQIDKIKGLRGAGEKRERSAED